MTIKRALIAPSNALFFVSDMSVPESPMPSVERIEVITNGKCILVPCQYEGDGDTDLTLGDYAEVPKEGVHVFEGSIPTASGLLVCFDVGLNELLSLRVETLQARINIWTDGLELPARIVIGVG